MFLTEKTEARKKSTGTSQQLEYGEKVLFFL